MTLSFERPVGAATDVAELEYVAALHQTDANQIRKDLTILDEDIALFLSSRYGIQLTKEQVRDRILEGFGSWSHDDTANTSFLDLVQIMSLLLIPTLCKEWIGLQDGDTVDRFQMNAGKKKPLLQYLLDMILHDVTGRSDPVRLTKSFLRDLFLVYSETELAQDDALLQQMIDTVTDTGGRTPRLTVANFARLLTSDLELYNVENETRVSTNFDDVFGETRASLGEKADVPLRPTYFESTSKARVDVHQVEASPNRADTPKYFESASRARVDVEASQMNTPADVFTVPVKFTASFIDFAADTYRSGYLVVALWVFFGVSFFIYYFQQWDLDVLLPECQSFEFREDLFDQLGTFFCTIGRSVLRWIYVIVGMSIYGLIYFSMTGIGNDIETKNPLLPLIGTISAATWTVISSRIFEVIFQASLSSNFMRTVLIAFGSSVAMINLFHFVGLMLPQIMQIGSRFQGIFTPQSIWAETGQKSAASHKIEKMVGHAISLHEKHRSDSVVETYFGQALFNYAETGQASERVGGFRWTWKGLSTLDLFQKEGVWVSGRLLSINISQFFVSLLVLLLGIVLTAKVLQDYTAPQDQVEGFLKSLFDLIPDTSHAYDTLEHVASAASTFFAEDLAPSLSCPELDNQTLSCLNNLSESANATDCFNSDVDICTLVGYTNSGSPDAAVQLQLLKALGFNETALNEEVYDNLKAAALEPVNSLYPEKYMVAIPVMVGTLAAFIVAVLHAVILLPSAVTSMMKFRSGLIPFVRDPKVRTLRIAPDQVAYLQGSAFWGLLYSAGLTGICFGGIAFLFFWQVTWSVAYHLLARLTGLVIVLVINWTLVKSLRLVSSKAYYRTRPAVSNIVILVRECAGFGLTVGFVAARAAKFVLTALLYVGRIDTPFLADGVGELEFFGYRLDGTPYVFLIDLLQHEAHRHPYIETLGVIYMMKVKHGSEFGTRVGSAWRLLFTMSLFPWLCKYRRLARPYLEEQHDADEEEDMTQMTGRLSIAVTAFSMLTKQQTHMESLQGRLRRAESERTRMEERESELERQVLRLKNELAAQRVTPTMKGGIGPRQQSVGLNPISESIRGKNT